MDRYAFKHIFEDCHRENDGTEAGGRKGNGGLYSLSTSAAIIITATAGAFFSQCCYFSSTFPLFIGSLQRQWLRDPHGQVQVYLF